MKQKDTKVNSPVCFYATKKMVLNISEEKKIHVNKYYSDSKFYPTKFYKPIIKL